MKKFVLAAAMIAVLAGPALASQCPSQLEKIDAALTTSTADEATKAKVAELSTKGKAEHAAGNHDAAAATIDEAMKLLGM